MFDYLSQVSPRSRQSVRVTLSPLLTTPPLLTVISPGIQLSEETPTVTIIKVRNLSIISIIQHYHHYLLSSVRYTLIVICWTVGRYSLQCVTVVGRWELCEHNTQVFSVDTRPLKGCPTKYVIRLSYILLHCPLLRYADISHALLIKTLSQWLSLTSEVYPLLPSQPSAQQPLFSMTQHTIHVIPADIVQGWDIYLQNIVLDMDVICFIPSLMSLIQQDFPDHSAPLSQPPHSQQ